ncbi:MAG: hypothetical protein IT176_03975 [Acidobacteria bacterium]|nr:hypothetical protein [Acidobacteriota bacterium]
MYTVILIGLGAMSALQLLLILRVCRRLEGTERSAARLSHFAEALALLTDTTEAGLSCVADAIGRGRRAPRAGGRATTRRIARAAGQGRSVADIAAEEALSESEIRLHLQMADDHGSRTEEQIDGILRI